MRDRKPPFGSLAELVPVLPAVHQLQCIMHVQQRHCYYARDIVCLECSHLLQSSIQSLCLQSLTYCIGNIKIPCCSHLLCLRLLYMIKICLRRQERCACLQASLAAPPASLTPPRLHIIACQSYAYRGVPGDMRIFEFVFSVSRPKMQHNSNSRSWSPEYC